MYKIQEGLPVYVTGQDTETTNKMVIGENPSARLQLGKTSDKDTTVQEDLHPYYTSEFDAQKAELRAKKAELQAAFSVENKGFFRLSRTSGKTILQRYANIFDPFEADVNESVKGAELISTVFTKIEFGTNSIYGQYSVKAP